MTSTFITALGIILVARFLGSSSYGNITLALIPISIASLFGDLGVNAGLIKYVSEYRSEGRQEEVNTLLRTGLLIKSTASLILFLAVSLSSGYISTTILRQPDLQPLIQLASLNLLAQSMIGTSRSIFVGYERMELYSLTVIFFSVLKSVLAPLLVLVGYGAIGAILGNTLPLSMTGIISLTLVIRLFLKPKNHSASSINPWWAAKILLRYGFPLFLSTLLAGSLAQVYNSLMALHIAPYDVGNYQAATNFSVLLSFFTIPIATVLFPLFSKLDHSARDQLRLVFQNSVKYAALITMPVTLVLIVLSEPLVHIIYGSSFPLTALYMRFFLLTFIFTGLGGLSVVSLLNGQGRTRVTFTINAINLCIGLPLSLVLIPRYGVMGLLATLILAPRPGLLYGLWWVKRNLGFTIDWRASAKIYLSSFSAYAISYFVLAYVNLGEWVELLVGASLFVTVYLVMIILLRTLKIGDVKNLRSVLGSMGPLTRFFNLFLNLFERLLG